MENLLKFQAMVLKDLKKYKLEFFQLRKNIENFENKLVDKYSRTESEEMSIRAFKKEFKIINEIYKGRFNGKCTNPSCNVDFRKLPALEFHHNDPNLKTVGWIELMHKKYSTIKKTLEQQDISLLCNNCHSLKDSKIYNKFKDLIMRKEIFDHSAKKIDNIIDKEIASYLNINKSKRKASYLKHEIKRWLKKRSIVEQLFNGGCIACGETSLPALQCHHTNPELKQNKWSVIARKWDIKKLIKDFFLKEECIILCANCHAMIKSSNFKNYVKFILGSEYKREVLTDYNKLEYNIKLFTFKIRKIKDNLGSLRIKDHLKLMIPKGDGWKKILIHIFYITQEKGINEININELSYSLNVSKKVVRVDLLPILLYKNYLKFKRKEGNAFLYNLTEKGQKFALIIIKDLSMNYPDEFINLLVNIKFC
ncbi:MAG: hypothetical protein HWN81_23515 [Candidatus Lokiarchaeota archaeon]|nr:hypothetical protein [Candidatus Lokiarchaeota archaeon]